MNKHLLFIIGLLISVSSFAQRDIYDWRIGAGGGWAALYGDLPTTESISENQNVYYSLLVERSWGNSFSLALQLQQTRMLANDLVVNEQAYDAAASNFTRALNCSTAVQSASLQLRWYADNGYVLFQRAALSPFLYAGVGYASFQPYGDLYQADGTRYYYTENQVLASDPGAGDAAAIMQDGVFETALAPLRTEGEAYATAPWMVPAGVGLKWRISDRWSLDVTAGAQYYFSDYIDDVSGVYPSNLLDSYPTNPSGRGSGNRGADDNRNDMNWQCGVSLHMALGEKKNRFTSAPITVQRNALPASSMDLQERTVLSTDSADATIGMAASTSEAPATGATTSTVSEADRISTGEEVVSLQGDTAGGHAEEPMQRSESTTGDVQQVREQTPKAIRNESTDYTKELEAIQKELAEMRQLVVGLYGAETAGLLLNNFGNNGNDTTIIYAAPLPPDTTLAADSSGLATGDSLAIPATSAPTDDKALALRLARMEWLLQQQLLAQDALRLQLTEIGNSAAVVDYVIVRDTVVVTDTTVVASVKPNAEWLPGAYNLFYRSGTTAPDKTAQAFLSYIASEWKRHPDYQLVLTGYADKTGDPAVNMQISMERAQAAAAYLQALGIPASAMDIKGVGDTAAPDGANALFRKVEISWMAP